MRMLKETDDTLLIALVLLVIVVSIFSCYKPIQASGIDWPTKFEKESHEIVTPKQCEEQRVVEVLFAYAPQLYTEGLRIANVHLHEGYASVYLSTDSGETHHTWLVDMDGKW